MTDEPVKSGENRKPGTFVKGDPRINRKGRPKDFNAARALAQQIAHEELIGEGDKPVTNRRGESVSRIEAILREWARSTNHKKQELFLAYAIGKPPSAVDVTSGGEKLEQPKVITDEQYTRAISTLIDAVREGLSGTGAKQDGTLGASE